MPVCHPTRLTLMTGKYPFNHGSVTWGDFPKSEEPYTFSNLLQEAGYRTGIAGKWQLCLMQDDLDHPQRLGFHNSNLFGWHEGPRYYEPMIYHNRKVRDDTLGHYGPDLYVHSLIEFMKANRDGPFLAYYPMAVAHDVTDDLKKPVPHGPFNRYDSYSEMVSEMDRAVGRLVAALNALQIREKTLILFAADNGTPVQMIIRADLEGQFVRTPVVSRRNGRIVPGGKGTLFNGGTSVPMIANWQGTIAPGQVVNDLVDFSDYLPTFCDLAGAQMPPDRQLDGHSFAQLLRGTGGSPRKWAFSEEAVTPKPGGVEPVGENSGLKWVRTANWKLYTDGRLFNMQKDDLEQRPLFIGEDTKKQAGERARLTAALKNLGVK
ncbi:MAG: sulfatase-like hydrolase/transferase, partial [Verrucomicrobia bacterium]|nr:sulfatase-like hydrolase/transferase [Verrucomicrobiota bacterium]